MSDNTSIAICAVAFFATVVLLAHAKTCQTLFQSTYEDCAQACGPSKMLEKNRDGDCRCEAPLDAGKPAP